MNEEEVKWNLIKSDEIGIVPHNNLNDVINIMTLLMAVIGP